MELIQNSHKRLEVPTVAIYRSLSVYVRYMLSVCLGMLIMVANVTALTRYMPASSNFFSAYTQVFPGQARSAVLAHGFSCAIGTYPVLPDESCTLNPAGGIFLQIQAVVSHGKIRQITFIPRKDMLRLGDLVALWGRPEIHDYGASTVLQWPTAGVVASQIPRIGRLSLFSPLWNVTITDTEG